MSRADLELPWYFGTGPSTAAGDSGLRSPLGGQLEAIASGTLAEYTIDAARTEDEMIRRIQTGGNVGDVRARLAELSHLDQQVLRLHYGTPALACNVTGAAVLASLAQRMTSSRSVTREALSAAIRASNRDRSSTRVTEIEVEALGLVKAAVQRYEQVQLPRSRKVWAE